MQWRLQWKLQCWGVAHIPNSPTEAGNFKCAAYHDPLLNATTTTSLKWQWISSSHNNLAVAQPHRHLAAQSVSQQAGEQVVSHSNVFCVSD